MPIRTKIECPSCETDLVVKRGGVCPNCGTPITEHVARVRARERRIEQVVAMVGVSAGPYAVRLHPRDRPGRGNSGLRGGGRGDFLPRPPERSFRLGPEGAGVILARRFALSGASRSSARRVWGAPRRGGERAELKCGGRHSGLLIFLQTRPALVGAPDEEDRVDHLVGDCGDRLLRSPAFHASIASCASLS